MCRQLQTFAADSTTADGGLKFACHPNRTDQPYWELEESEGTPTQERKPNQPMAIRYNASPESKNTCQLRREGDGDDDDDDVLIKI